MRHWRDRLGGWCIRLGMRLISDRHALWFWTVQTDYWTSARGQALRRDLAGQGER